MRYNCSNDILNALIKAEADFSIQNDDDHNKQTPLHIMVQKMEKKMLL